MRGAGEGGLTRDITDDVSDAVVPPRVVVYHRDAVGELLLRPEAPTVVGRSESADVTLRSSRLSRRHAALSVDDEGIWIEDLGSSNGTSVNGELITRRTRLRPGDRAQLGSVQISVPVPLGSTARSMGLMRHDAFERALADEVARARAFRRSVAVLTVEHPAEGVTLADWCPHLEQHVRPFDRLALYGSGVMEIMRVETDVEGARALAERIVQTVEPRGARVGHAVYPADGGGGDLVATAMARMRGRPARARPVDLKASGPVVASPAMERVMAFAARIARSNIPVLVTGETGSGKEIVAREVHRLSGRADKPLHAINCGAIPESLVASVLFGHERGAFTSADTARAGIFETGDGATVLLDEIGELPMAAQVTLLRVLDAGTVRRVGASSEKQVDVRVIACTNRDLDRMTREGTFRLDLYHRINAVTLEVPPLRERRSAIPALVERFLEVANEEGARHVRGVSPGALACIEAYDWPGNLRELRNVIHRAVVVAVGDQIEVDDLPASVRQAAAYGVVQRPIRLEGPRDATTLHRSRGDTTPPPPARAATPIDIDELGVLDPGCGLRDLMRAVEKELVDDALARVDGNQTQVAHDLRIPRRTLTYKIRAWADDPPPDACAGIYASLASPGDGSLPYRDRVAALEQRLLRRVLVSADGDLDRAASLLGIGRRTLARKLDLG